MKYIIPTTDLEESDISSVGMKNYGLKRLHDLGVRIPHGFALTTDFFGQFMEENNFGALVPNIRALRDGYNPQDLQRRILQGRISPDLQDVLKMVYDSLGKQGLAVRSSSNFEDTHSASFAGQYESVIGVYSQEELQRAVLSCFASTYSPRVLDYLASTGVSPTDVLMPLVVQEMIDASNGVSGVILSRDPLTSLESIMYIEANKGFGEKTVSGDVRPDSFQLRKGDHLVLQKEKGESYNINFCLSEEDLRMLGRIAETVDNVLGYGVDLEYVIASDEAVFVQLRPLVETAKPLERVTVERTGEDNVLARGVPVVNKSATGTLHLYQPANGDDYKGDIVYLNKLRVTDIPHLTSVEGLVVRELGLGSHPALIIREKGIPTIVNTGNSFSKLSEGDFITLDCDRGEIIEGTSVLKRENIEVGEIPQTRTKIYVAVSTPEDYKPYKDVPVSGVCVRSGDYMIVSKIGVHPKALLDFDKGAITGGLREEIASRIRGYNSAGEYFVRRLRGEIALLGSLNPKGASFMYRFSDLQTTDYAQLLGSGLYEAEEENPMIGVRGVSRMLDPRFEEAFDLEARAVCNVRDDVGFRDMRVFVPYCRTLEDGRRIRDKLERYGFAPSNIGMMVEIASNCLFAREFADIFNFFVVGPGDLTQSLLAADRNNADLARYHNPGNEVTQRAVEVMLQGLNGCGREVIIGGHSMFQHYDAFSAIATNNTLSLAELPGRLVDSIKMVYGLEGGH